MFRKEKSWVYSTRILFIDCKQKNFRNISEKMYTCLFLICVNIYQMFIYL